MGRTILIVDDDADLRQQVCDILHAVNAASRRTLLHRKAC